MRLCEFELLKIKEKIIEEFSPCFIKLDRTGRALFVLKFSSDEEKSTFLSDERFAFFVENELIFAWLSYIGINELISGSRLGAINIQRMKPSLILTAYRLFLPYNICERRHEESVSRAMRYLSEDKIEELAIFMEHEYARAKREKQSPAPLGFLAQYALLNTKK